MEYAPFVAAGLYHMVEKGRKEAFFFEKKNLKTLVTIYLTKRCRPVTLCLIQ
jgi:hypothetical protein